jgi:hypothetical protein
MYIDEQTQEELNQAFDEHNARRVFDGKPQVEKNKHFFEGIVRCALDNDWEEYVKDVFDEYER